jgi:transposase-like protein
MVKCSRCGAQTILHVNGVPVCPECDKKFSEESSTPRPADAGSEKGRKPPVKAQSQAVVV